MSRETCPLVGTDIPFGVSTDFSPVLTLGISPELAPGILYEDLPIPPWNFARGLSWNFFRYSS